MSDDWDRHVETALEVVERGAAERERLADQQRLLEEFKREGGAAIGPRGRIQ